MNYILSVGTVNLNSSNSDLNQNLLKDFIRDYNLDVIFLQEVVFENFRFINSHKAIVNRQPRSLGTAMLIRNGLDYKDVLYHPNGRILSATVADINFVNVYAFSGTNRKKERDEMFQTDLAVHLSKYPSTSMILGGDFNCILETGDSRNSTKNYSTALRSLTDSLKLSDVLLKKKSNEYTFLRGDTASRIDRFYAHSSMIENIIQAQTVTVVFSDHRAVFFKLKVQKQNLALHGRGYWKINAQMVDNDEISSRFSTEFENLKNRHIYSTDRSSWWNFAFKRKCRSFFKNESWIAYKSLLQSKQSLHHQMNNLTDRLILGEDVYDELQVTKSKIMEIEIERMAGSVYKLGPKSLSCDEKISVYQIAAQLKRSSSYIRLKDNGVLISDPSLLGNSIFEHFSKLFDEDHSDEVNNEDVLSDVDVCLDLDDQNMLIAPISIDEIQTTLKMCSSKKSPGPDGLTYEFYLKNFDTLKEELCYIYNSYLLDSITPPKEFTSGIITLIPKKGDAYDLNNLRPISLLNADYKLFSKILANRIKTVLKKIVGPGQVACVDNKSCVDNIKNIRRLITRSLENKRVKGFLVSLDLQKAFDSVSHAFLWKILRKYGFPDKLVTCLQQ